MGHDDAREGGEATAGHHPNARDARVKELNEMTIGRTDDPEIPLPAQAFEAAEGVWDWIADPIWASGHEPHKQAGHMIESIRPSEYSCIRGAVHTCGKINAMNSGPESCTGIVVVAWLFVI